MAARVTKQFLQNVLQNAKTPKALSGAKGSTKSGLLGSLAKNQQQTKKKLQASQQQSKKVRGGKKKSGSATSAPTKKKASKHYLDVAKKEQAHADRTAENLRKLQVPPTNKSQRLMAKVLALRKKALH